jgi:hypothetical protein
MIRPTEVRSEVQRIMAQCSPHYLSAYQILEMLPVELRDQIINKRGRPGEGGGSYYGPGHVVEETARGIPGVT